MSKITDGEQYVSLFKFDTSLAQEQHFLCFDQAKTNLFWLVEPRIDKEGIEAARGNPIAKDIDALMDVMTRHTLQGIPLPFVSYWLEVDREGAALMAQNWPDDYRTTMKLRAKEAQCRLLGIVLEGENLTKVNFSRASSSIEASETGETADSAESQFKLGKKYHDGDRVKRDLEKAAECYSKAAKLGHARAQNNLGLLYSLGFGTHRRDKKEAAAWFMKAAEQGLDIAQYNIASYFLEKDGALPYDPEQAVMWYLKAAEQGNSDAQCSLGEMFEEGIGVSQDDQQAKSFYLKAALQDDETAQSWLWRRTRLESTEQPERLLEDAMPATTTNASFRLAPDHAVALVRAAIDLLKKNPTAFLPELAELRSLVFENNVAAHSQTLSSDGSSLPGDTPSLAKVAKWLLGQESVTVIALRAYLLPLDLLPSAVIDELNERALDLTGEVAFDEVGDEILVVQEILAAVLADWQEPA